MGYFSRSRRLEQSSWNSGCLSNNRFCIQTARAVDVIIAEHALRQHAQRIETMNIRASASRKTAALEDGLAKSKRDSEMLDQIQKQRPEKERALYRALSLLNEFERKRYDELRCDPTWFMNEYLIQDCSDQGGCCSRQCGCCAKRHPDGAGKGAAGHCTPECWCCISDRGFDLSKETKKEVRDDMKGRLGIGRRFHYTSPYLLTIVSGNFLPPKAKKKHR